MKNSRLNTGIAGLVILLGLIPMILMGCSGGSDSGGSASGGSGGDTGGGTTTTTYICSGKISDLVNGSGLSTATCSLNGSSSKGERYSNSVATDSNGSYSFTNVPAGNYTLQVTSSYYVTINDNFAISTDTVRNDSLINVNDWNTLMSDTTHPYDTSTGYVVVNIYDRQTGGISGATVACTPATYSGLGYVTTNGTINWNASSTTANGGAFFYKVTPGQSYTLSVSNTDTSFSSVSATVKAGEISIYNFVKSSI